MVGGGWRINENGVLLRARRFVVVSPQYSVIVVAAVLWALESLYSVVWTTRKEATQGE